MLPLLCSAIGVVPRQMVRFSGRVGNRPLREESFMAPLFLCPVGSPPVATAPSLALSAALDVLVVLETLEELDILAVLDILDELVRVMFII